jgi:VanZ family protein
VQALLQKIPTYISPEKEIKWSIIPKYAIKTTFSGNFDVFDVMKKSKEQKFFTIILIFYWVCIFISTHIPVPNWTRQMGVSDKTMHFAAYMTLTLMLWFGTSFEKKADWRKFLPWLLLIIVLLYGAADELSQQYLRGRSTDIIDFGANALGATAAMAIVTVLPARHAVMILLTTCPLFAPAIVKSHLITADSIYEAAAYMTGMAIITASWIKYLSSIFNLNLGKIKCLLMLFAPPAATVVLIKLYASLTDKPFGITAILVAFASIILTLFIWRLISKK